MDTIYLQGVRAKTLIGWYDWERVAPQDVELDLDIGLPSARASVSDDLIDTIDYDLVVKTLRSELENQHFLLLEALAEFIAQLLLDRFSAPWVRISVTKPGILQDVARVGVTIERGQRN
ncbi:7,8-dihydroneopterin aldolase [Jeongeupia sp. HS-3]|uniref:dihydroneopterin aldolase n=1 Tax=Jeongeupia sp. HS-3 TaxID=1009682 RepID=UPI0018A6602E|nr:dihydroneopterin aldolase [Jeongeupia sp. HS-3]BCL75525.1 7,8-dihydroneopterin aldolase [Jeongeupia sp. HS-3]